MRLSEEQILICLNEGGYIGLIVVESDDGWIMSLLMLQYSLPDNPCDPLTVIRDICAKLMPSYPWGLYVTNVLCNRVFTMYFGRQGNGKQYTPYEVFIESCI